MHCSRNASRCSPSVVRVVRPNGCRRNASFFPGPVGFPRFHGPAFPAANEFAPLFRLFDGITAPIRHQNAFGFQPRFDVREVGDSYELRGDLPGVESKDVEVEFTDAQTLVIRGRTESGHTSGTPQAAADESTKTDAEVTKEAATEDDDAASTYSTGSYQKPSVEDEATAESSADAKATETTAAEPAKTEANQEPASRYWISERSTGSFQRVFKFPSKVDQEAVTASLKNGILNIVVPKAAIPEPKKINVE